MFDWIKTIQPRSRNKLAHHVKHPDPSSAIIGPSSVFTVLSCAPFVHFTTAFSHHLHLVISAHAAHSSNDMDRDATSSSSWSGRWKVGWRVGWKVGWWVGWKVGWWVGWKVGWWVSLTLGWRVGWSDH